MTHRIEPDACATQLDLARAYIDMGDPDASWHLLQQVIDNGNVDQRARAHALMDLLPCTHLPITASSAAQKVDLSVATPNMIVIDDADGQEDLFA